MPGKVKVKVLAGRNLPVMDRSSDTTDAFVEVKLGDTTYKTDVYRKSLNPAWNSEWFRFEADDLELQDEPLQIRVMDYDTYSANDAIGKVYVDLNPLLLPQAGHRPLSFSESINMTLSATGGTVMSGWLPIFDTMHGIRGEINLIIKVEFFSDLNKFRQSSCGVQFFCAPEVPEGYRAQFLPGFVEELVVNDDPEYKWIDKIRTPRASNEARQLLFMKLSGEVRRRIGLKVLELGGNAVIGYKQYFDLEGESGIVVRGIGTVATLSKLLPWETPAPQVSPVSAGALAASSPRTSRENSATKDCRVSPEFLPGTPTTPASAPVLVTNNPWSFDTSPSRALRTQAQDPSVNPRRPEPDLATPPKGATGGNDSGEKLVGKPGSGNKGGDAPEMAEYPFLTLTKFSPHFLVHLGGMVSAKSVKLLEELDEREDGDTREAWWAEIRQEVRSHARALACNIILGYEEKTVIWEDVIILSAAGTAAVCNLSFMSELDSSVHSSSQGSQGPFQDFKPECSQAHIPYSEGSVPFPIKLVRCGVCGRGRVPDILLTSVEPPPQIEIVGRGGLIQARVLKLKKAVKGDSNAREVSDALPFLEYELHRQLVNKLKVKGMNAVFGLQVSLSLSDRVLVGMATGTAVYLAALPPPVIPTITSSASMFRDQNHITRVQARLMERVEAYKEYYGLGYSRQPAEEWAGVNSGEADNDLELTTGSKDTCVLEVDDTEDVDRVDGLLDVLPPPGMQVMSVHSPLGVDPGLSVPNCQAFTQVWRGKPTLTARDFGLAAQNMVNSVCFKLRRLKPCLLSGLTWDVKFDEDNELQLCLSGVALALGPSEQEKKQKVRGDKEELDLLFRMEGLLSVPETERSREKEVKEEGDRDNQKLPVSTKSNKTIKIERSPPFFFAKNKVNFGINVTSMPYVPGARIEHHLGNLNFFFIRETTSIRELGGLSSFIQLFLSEVLAILRSHVAALGGNAITSYFLSKCELSHSIHKNQAQCLINLGGDCVSVVYVTSPDKL